MLPSRLPLGLAPHLQPVNVCVCVCVWLCLKVCCCVLLPENYRAGPAAKPPLLIKLMGSAV